MVMPNLDNYIVIFFYIAKGTLLVAENCWGIIKVIAISDSTIIDIDSCISGFLVLGF